MEKQESILVIGDIDSIWVRDFIHFVLLPLGYKVSVVKEENCKCKFEDFYLKNNVNIIDNSKKNKLLLRLPIIRRFYLKNIFKYRCKKKFTKVFTIYTTAMSLILAKTVVCTEGEIFSVFIGSDLLRTNRRAVCLLKQQLEGSNIIPVCVSENVKERLVEIQKKFEKCKIIDFGNAQLPQIDTALEKGKIYNKQHWKLDPNKFSVGIGYNGLTSQQHIRVIQALGKLEPKEKDKIVIFLQLMYGCNDEYIRKIKDAIIESGIECVYVTKFLEPDEIASLRVATDIFLNVQTTDALSASLLEHIYAGSVVICGKWLEYPKLREWKITLDEVEKIDDIPNALEKIIQFSKVGEEVGDNKDILRKYASWDKCMMRWKEVIEEKMESVRI